MMQLIKNHLRLILLTGVAVGLTVVFVVLQPSYKKTDRNTPANNQKPSSQTTETPEITEEPYQFPFGGRELLPGSRMVALYGTPGTAVLGSLGEQPVEAAIDRVKQLASEYQKFSDEKIYPAFEIIASIAAAEATENGDYSRETSIEKLQPWVDAAGEAGVYVILDLQPGLTSFYTQAKYYEPLLKLPHVGLALDPEWRLKPGQKHMKQIGSVPASEVNQTANWLAGLVKSENLPQKMLLIHQFKLSMIGNRETLDTSRSELAWVIQMDGLGAQHVKQDTWRNVTANPPDNIYFGWKNFIDEDKPMLTPEQTMTTVAPKPYYISYQ